MIRLFRRASATEQDVEAAPPRIPSVGEGRRVYAIGDIHGRRDLLYRLLDQIVTDCTSRGVVGDLRLIFLGDLIDRGPDSRGVVDLAMTMREFWSEFVCLKGNHEEVFALALSGDLAALRFFLRIGGRETLLSYGVDAAMLEEEAGELLFEQLMRRVPEAHRDFFIEMPDSHVIGDYLFVHAGLRPGIALEDQLSSDLHWIRDEFLTSEADHGYMVVHGHTITEFVDEQPNRIGIDTGAFASDRLTAIGLEGTERWFLST